MGLQRDRQGVQAAQDPDEWGTQAEKSGTWIRIWGWAWPAAAEMCKPRRPSEEARDLSVTQTRDGGAQLHQAEVTQSRHSD